MALSPLERTFCHIRTVGRSTEQTLWDRGCQSWYDVLGGMEPVVSPGFWRLIQEECEESHKRFFDRDWKWFSRRLAVPDQWRLFSSVPGPIAYIDIETTGCSTTQSDITIVGLYDGESAFIYLADFRDLREQPPVKPCKHRVVIALGTKLEAKMAEMGRIVTFNGSSFDLPILRRTYPDIDFGLPHLDLRTALRALGLKGGLKRIEIELGIERPSAVKGMNGYDAVIMWQNYRNRNDLQSLARLIEYNVQDIANLQTLTKHYLDRMITGMPEGTSFIL